MNAWTPERQAKHDQAFHKMAEIWQDQQIILQQQLAELYRESRHYRSILSSIPESDIPNEKIEARAANDLPPTFGELDGPRERRRRLREEGSESTLKKGMGKGKGRAKDFLHERGDFSGDSSMDAEMDDIDLDDLSDESDLSIPSDLAELVYGQGYSDVSPASSGKTIKRKGKMMGLGRGFLTEEESLTMGSSRDFEMCEEMPSLELAQVHGHGHEDPFRGRAEKRTSSSQIRRNMTLRSRNSSLAVAVDDDDDDDDDDVLALSLTPTKGPRLRINGPKPRRRHHSTLSVVDLGSTSPEKDLLGPLDRKLKSQEQQVGGSSESSKEQAYQLERSKEVVDANLAKEVEASKARADELEQPGGMGEAETARVAGVEARAPRGSGG
ncbi:MAG: hypothetical protein LQ350_002662 [Teloschistes chrysophthalmus]|nr:MAG: hypothetical protein LQ350_002662 [Niorma chrysophthalma]